MRDTQCMCTDGDVSQDSGGNVDFDALLSDPEIEELIWADSVPFWDVADPDGSLRQSLPRSAESEQAP
jgi:hypothetical protein